MTSVSMSMLSFKISFFFRRNPNASIFICLHIYRYIEKTEIEMGRDMELGADFSLISIYLPTNERM